MKEMKNKKLIVGIIVGVLIVGLLIGSYFMFFYSPWKFTDDRPIKIFYLNSYMSNWSWTDDKIHAFKEIFEEAGIEIEVRQFDMETFDESVDKILAGEKAKKEIDNFGPDLIFATDDNAQEYVIKENYLNTNVPVVFAGMNLDPEDYGYVGSRNVAGVLERESLTDYMGYLRKIFPHIKKIAVISDDFSQWSAVIERMKEEQNQIPNLEVAGWHMFSDYVEYKKAVLDYQDKVDALVFLGLTTIKDENGVEIPDIEIIKWTNDNSNLPEIAPWGYRVSLGQLSAVDISAFAQGEAAGKIAYGILIEGKAPSSFEFKPTREHIDYINLARAKTLGIEKEEIPSVILINSEVIEKFPWEEIE